MNELTEMERKTIKADSKLKYTQSSGIRYRNKAQKANIMSR